MSSGLVYVQDSEPGIRRVRRGRGFSYLRADGEPVSPQDRERIGALAIPPAWNEVWICADPAGHLQATGRDSKGRKQYRYHDRWRASRDRDKYARLAEFGANLTPLREQVEQRLSGTRTPSRQRVVTLVLALLDETLIRVGNPEYAANGSFGLTTLRNGHVSSSGRGLRFRFTGKSGVEHEVDLEDPRLARWVRRCHQLGGQHLFTYLTADGEVAPVTSADVNDELRDLTGGDASAKDFRTWGGTAIVAESLAAAGTGVDDDVEAAVVAAVDEAADRLGNTRAVCRSSYVHPAVVDAAESGELGDIWRRSRATRHLRRAEAALLKVLDS